MRNHFCFSQYTSPCGTAPCPSLSPGMVGPMECGGSFKWACDRGSFCFSSTRWGRAACANDRGTKKSSNVQVRMIPPLDVRSGHCDDSRFARVGQIDDWQRASGPCARSLVPSSTSLHSFFSHAEQV